MFAWHGKILRINLTTKAIKTETVDERFAAKYLGGRGWAIKYLLDEMDPTIDAFDPENMLIFATGPLTGTVAPTGNRYMVVTKSPLTGALTNSNSGGFFPTEMKRTGFDLFIIEGKADSPVYIWINNETVELRSAEHVWGKNVPETEDLLLAETDRKAKVACIGPAGENLVLFASIMNDKHRAAGRSGVGAVMGSKNLKAVVVRGTQSIEIAHPDQLDNYCKAISKKVGDVMKAGGAMRVYGTSYVPPITNEMGILPTRNFQTGRFEGIDGITGDVINEKYLKKPKPCFRCPIACGRDTKVDDPKYAGEGEGPEYETIASYGSACGVDNMAAIIKANYLCNEYGIDTISAGMTIACAMELAEKGFIPREEIGFDLKFGDPDAIIELTHQISSQTGFGKELAQGSFRLAEKYGHPEISVTAKKQEFPGYDPRGSKGMGLLYATSNKGASHMSGDLAYSEVFGVPKKIDALSLENKPELIKRFEDAFTVIDSTGLCVFLSVRYMFEDNIELWPTPLAEVMRLSTGVPFSQQMLLDAGDRIFNMERLFLLRAGFTKEDDSLPYRMLNEPLPDGPAKGHVVELDLMLPRFYQLRGWDPNGIPTKDTLDELEIGDLLIHQ
ncbi:MAG TPA: aldehyde ferredoxin oxidoreductase family protein [Anaerolineaceae bacterium]|nr:aldehyde ferredoxin oxidoreductase family protein [Anaerolineaceae bacterium]